MLDDGILLDVLDVAESEIQVQLNTQDLPDLYLKGLHKLSLEHTDYYTDTLIQVGDPVPSAESLAPQIETVEILFDDDGDPVNLRLTGKYFPVQPKFYYALVDGEFGFGHQTEVLADGTYETVVHLPEPETFDPDEGHMVILATPFGVAFEEF